MQSSEKGYDSPMWKNYAKEVYKRDNYICNFCGFNCRDGRKANAHHRLYYKKDGKFVELWDYPLYGSNPAVINLCETCHNGFHKFHGFTSPIIDKETGEIMNEDEPTRITRLAIEKQLKVDRKLRKGESNA